MTIASSAEPRRVPGRLLPWAGLGLAGLGVAGYAAQLAMHRLTAPWYLPVLATLGAAVAAAALWQRRSVWRGLALILTVLVAAAGWMFILTLRLPAYTGPVAAGQPFPEFATTRADGEPFTQRNLQGDQNSVLVFFRGRW